LPSACVNFLTPGTSCPGRLLFRIVSPAARADGSPAGNLPGRKIGSNREWY